VIRALRSGATLLLALVAGLASAATATGFLQLPAGGEDGPVTMFYPSSDPARAVQLGPFNLTLALQGKPVRGNGRLVVMSHGTHGSGMPHADLAGRLVAAGFIVAIPLHRGDNYVDASDAGPASWKRRPIEISRTIDRLAADPRFAGLLALDKVGMFGMSAGGHTALTLAGGRWSPAVMRKHCELHLDDDFASCVGLAFQLQGNVLDGAKKLLARAFLARGLADDAWYTYTDPRIAAIVAEVPYSVNFDMASLATPRVPLGLIRNGKDIWLKPAYHIDAVLRACGGCTLVADLPTAGHGSLMSPQLPTMPEPAESLLRDPPGFDRSLVPPAHAAIVTYFRQHLLP
jgi:predicted dienelactone hydrolase